MLKFSENLNEYALVIVLHEDQIKIHKMWSEWKIKRLLSALISCHFDQFFSEKLVNFFIKIGLTF